MPQHKSNPPKIAYKRHTPRVLSRLRAGLTEKERRGIEKGKKSKWRARQDSNPQPLGPKPSALSIELQARGSTRKSWGERRGSNP